MKIPSMFRKAFSRRAAPAANLSHLPPAIPAAPPAAAPMSDEEFKVFLAAGGLAFAGILLANLMERSSSSMMSSLRDTSMRLLTTVVGETTSKIEAYKASSR